MATVNGVELNLPGNVTVDGPEEVAAYLAQHPGLAALLPALCAKARETVGEGAELLLDFKNDPDDPELRLYIRLPQYVDTLNRLKPIQDWWYQVAEDLEGWVFVSTDYRPPGFRYGV